MSFELFGASTAFFIGAALINYYCRYLEDNNKHPFLQKVLTVVLILLFIPSLLAAIPLFLIYHLYQKRLGEIE